MGFKEIMKKSIGKYLIIAFSLGLLVLAGLSIRQAVIASKNKQGQSNLEGIISPEVLEKDLNREILVAVKAKPQIEIKYSVVSAEIQEEILVRGERMKAASGRVFLIFNLKISNEGKQAVQISSRDFIRIAQGSNDEWLAPDIHNDPVEVQAISTKYTRVGFAVDKNIKNFKVRLGEIAGDKEEFEVNF